MRLVDNYKIIYEEIERDSSNKPTARIFKASKTGSKDTNNDARLARIEIGSYELIYEKDGKLYASTENKPTSEDTELSGINDYFANAHTHSDTNTDDKCDVCDEEPVYTISFIDKDDTAPTPTSFYSEIVEAGQSFTLPKKINAPLTTNRVYTSWVDETGATLSSLSIDKVDRDRTFKGTKTVACPVTVYLSSDLDQPVDGSTDYLLAGEINELLAQYEEQGYTWYTNKDCTELWDKTAIASGTLTLYKGVVKEDD